MNRLLLLLSILSVGAPAGAAMAVAELMSTSDSTVKGTVQLEDTSGGLRVKAQLINVPAGAHGFHIHEFGSCADAAKAAGSHYNPNNTPHGHMPKDGLKTSHPGDLGNITADASGAATLEAVLPGVTLTSGPLAVAGRAVVLHEKADDFSQPVGNAGGRIACGSVLIVGSN
jgi:superoxide dismutase, Cu-Zn family